MKRYTKQLLLKESFLIEEARRFTGLRKRLILLFQKGLTIKLRGLNIKILIISS